jgi:hypothetical protein
VKQETEDFAKEIEKSMDNTLDPHYPKSDHQISFLLNSLNIAVGNLGDLGNLSDTNLIETVDDEMAGWLVYIAAAAMLLWEKRVKE